MKVSKVLITTSLGISLFLLASCSPSESKTTTEIKETNVSSEIKEENKKYIPDLENKFDKDSTFSVSEISYSITNVSIVEGVNSTKLAKVSYEVKNNANTAVIPNEFWYRYVTVTQGGEEPLAIGALSLEEKDKSIHETIQQAELPLKKNKTVAASAVYVIEDTSDVTLTFFNTDFSKIGSKEYELNDK